MKKEKSDPKVSEGFTLIELIVSVVIISVVCVVGYHFISKLWQGLDMQFKSLCQKCPIQKTCPLPCKIFEIDKCDTYDYAVNKSQNSAQHVGKDSK